jgi:hypothetical protein
MSTFAVFSEILSVITFLFCTGLLIFSRLRKWADVQVEILPVEAEQPDVKNEPLLFREHIIQTLKQNKWGVILASTITAIFLFAIIFAPPRLTGRISTDLNLPGRPFYNLHWQRSFLNANMDMLSGAGGIFFCLICVLLITHATRNRSRLHSEIALLLASLNIAILAQWNIAKDFQSVGAGFYAIAVVGFLYWAWFAHGR